MFINFKPVEEPKKITNTKELAEYILDKSSGIENMTEEDRAKTDAKIMAKLESGKKLSQKEMTYLMRTIYSLKVQIMHFT